MSKKKQIEILIGIEILYIYLHLITFPSKMFCSFQIVSMHNFVEFFPKYFIVDTI